jgi:hypothetical protein
MQYMSWTFHKCFHGSPYIVLVTLTNVNQKVRVVSAIVHVLIILQVLGVQAFLLVLVVPQVLVASAI